MSHTSEIPFVPHSTTLCRGVKRAADDSNIDSEGQTRRARPNNPHLSPQYHAGDDVDLSVGGNFSADGGGDVAQTGYKSLKSAKRCGGDVAAGSVPAIRKLWTCDDESHCEDGMPPAQKGLRFDASCNDIYAPGCSSSRLSKWQSPRTSPLGPKTSPYCRRSRCRQPCKKFRPVISWVCLMRNLYNDNMMRDPYKQDVQWCQDLHLSKLKDILQPMYVCQHVYHPCDPEYDEEWPDESWSDEEWSDSEDTLPTSDDYEIETDVAIFTPEEPKQASTSETFAYMQWDNWGIHLNSKSSTVEFHTSLMDLWSPPVYSWDPQDDLETNAKESRNIAFTEAADLVAAA